MNSRGYPISKENEAQGMNCWVPATPNIPISSRVNPVPIQSQGTNLETSNWHQLLEFPNDWPLESMNSYQSVQDLDPYQQAVRNGVQTFNPNSFLALLGADGTYGLDGPFLDNNLRINSASQVYPSMHQSFNNVTGTLGNSNSAAVNHPLTAYQFVAQNRSQQSPQVVNRPAIPNLNVQASVDWMGNHSATMPMMNQNHRPISNAGTASNYVFGSPEDHFPVPGRVEYNLNVRARAETEPSFTKTLEFFHHASATINQATKSQEKKQCEILELPELNGDLSQDGNKQISVVENVTKQNSVLLQPNADNSSHIVSTPEKILGNEKEGGKVNDLEKTPHHKTPKRRKHRPKVIREGKPKKTPKSETPKNSKLSEKPKRKYTRKSSLNASGSQPSEVIVQTGGKIEEPATKSCRKALSFEQEKTAEQTEEMQNTQPEVMHQMSKVRFDLNLDNQDTEISSVDKHMFKGDNIVRSGQNESLPYTNPAQVINKLAHSMPWGPIVNGQHLERPPPTQATTFQDLLTGSKNSAGSFTNVGNTTPNPKSQVQAMYSTGLYMAEEQLAMQRRQAELQTLYQRATTMENLNAVMPQQGTNINLQGVRHPPTQTNSFQELLMGNQNYAQVSARSQIVNVNQNNSRPYYPVQRLTGAENTGKLGYQTINSHNNLGEYGQKILSRSNQPVIVTSDQSETRRSKRERDFIIDQLNYNNNASISYSNASRVTEGGYQSEYATQQILQEAEKKRRIENILHMEMSRTQSQHFDTIQSRQLLANMGNSAASMRTSHFNPYPWMSYPTNIRQSAEYSRFEGLANGVSTSASLNQYFNQHTSSGQPSNISQVQNRGNLTIARVSSSPISASNHNVQPIPAKSLLLDCQRSVKNSSSAMTEKQYSRPTPSGLLVKTVNRAASPGDPQAITTVLTNKSGKSTAGRSLVSSRKKGNDYQPSSSSKRGQLRKKDIRDLIDELVHQMEHLSLDKTSENRKPQHENAIVPYIGDGPVVMYQAKKRKPRPKVDLDAESERIWKLLMGKEGPTEGTDVDKEKWWEQERNMFKLRATAFISRMHMVQGDRQFSKWKGSVVDSVIGVFLTQNVSDHLSSSAFMSLAARFPLSLSSRANWDDVIIEEEPEICIIDLEDTISNDDAKQILSQSHFVASENERKSTTSGAEIVNLEDDKIRGANNKTVSLDSFDNSICLTNRGSSSGSNSEVEEPLTTRSPSVLYKTGKLTDIAQLSTRDSPLESPERSLHHPEKPQGASEKECQQLSGGESTSSCHACDASECSSNTSDPEMQNRKNLEQNGQLRGKTEARPNLNEQLKSRVVHQQGILTSTPCQETTQHHYNDHHLKSQTFQSDKSSAIKEMAEPSSRGKGLSSTPNINSKGSSPKTRNGKQDTDIKTIDWDELRKEAQRKIKRSKNKNNMDSMDYETMRHAEVKEISDAIKERGMNNMLAERIKDFLNRLVKDHGSVDLEWLRDAPPDKAKDYLLSIRGLGLKSVECVRLLTLHHLAFPVDTNVGRIAVRLGWVPLQPLPESLQLHLLEMYPVLETIQKYLWPRLCKLDQRTLYELHYQMITFGKVFCTKSKPNCNACPMRAECRHFASAFASARLALPAPEERNIVPTRLPVQSDRSPDVATSFPSRTLLEWDNQLFGLERFKKTNCEPIVEEPKTPEPEPEEVSEIDIEDSFGEDTEDIPTIQLDVPKFAQTLQSYIHDNNIDVQEKEMSNALVALTAEAASLPPQKLKNVSRLRTEHQVYELPDSHPLLSEMDKREPDDPSPYLLAIWTPGETPMSTQPPESRCQSDDPNKMCSEQTCFSCNSKREADSNIVRGTLLIPCRTAMRGSFPLNGTYFQVNEMFADHESSMNPIYVPREWIWNLPRRTVYFGTSVTTIFKGLSTQGIQYCFWRGFVCVRGFDQRYRAPRPLLARLHHPASKLVKNQGKRRNGRPVQDEE